MGKLAVALVLSCCIAAPSAARAQCRNGPECLSLGVGKLDPKITAIVGAGAAALLAAGATAAALRTAREKAPPDGVVDETDEQGRHHARLLLVPPAPPLPPAAETFRYDTGALRFNDYASTAIIALGGAAILGSIVAGFARKH